MSDGRYRPYPDYKDSGVDWLGHTPLHWELSRLKYLAQFSGGGTPNKDTAAFWNGNIPWVSPKDMKGRFVDSTIDNVTPRAIQHSSTNLLAEGALLMVVRSGILQHSIPAAINRVPVTLNQDMKALRFGPKMTVHFAQYFVMGNQRPLLLEWCKQGATVESIEQELLGSSRVPIPPIPEQTQIAKFLDHETAKIDRLIEKQEALIRLLKEKRQAVISHAVTKGLNPHAPLKDSGIPWLGQVPAHWEACRLKHVKSTAPNAFVDGPFGSNLKSEHFVEDGEVYVIESNFATTGNLDTTKLKKITRRHFKTVERSSTKGGDIIIAKIGARYGSSSILPDLDSEAVVSGNSLKLSVNERLVINEYANELLRFLKANEAMDEGVNITAQPALSLGDLNNLPFLRVPLDEQVSIVAYIHETKAKFDALIQNAEEFVTLSNERRTALISAAVTGKIDVRHWQPPVVGSKMETTTPNQN
ncbi:MAG TPA: restriction endonuclease subunit S [Opitutaceae bacterium]